MMTLKHLEEKLRREMPQFGWECRSKPFSRNLAGTDIPEEFQITASLKGERIAGCPWKFNGNLLVRWGVDATATLVLNEFIAPHRYSGNPQSMAWDRLSEI